MRFAHFSHVWNKPGMSPAARYAQLWDELALCDEVGFDYAFCVEHHFRPFEALMPTPSIYCASAAARTKRLRLGPMGYIVPLYDPLRILEEAAVLDNVLGGRLELGLVSGIAPDYFGPYGADFQNRRAITQEALSLVKTAFSAPGPFSFDGEYHSLIFVGSPATVARDIRRAADQGMINTVLCELNFGSMSDEEIRRSITLFGTQVIPALRDYEPF